MPRPVSESARDGLVLDWGDVEKTGTYRQTRPEYRTERSIWIDVPYNPETDDKAFENAFAVKAGIIEKWRRDDGVIMLRFTVPAGFVSDRYSLSRRIRFRQPKHPAWWGPSIIHDAALEFALFSIERANELFNSAMKQIGVSWFDRQYAMLGVEFARRWFPGRITVVDADNIEMVERVTGRDVASRVSGERRGSGAYVLRVVKAAGAGFVQTKVGAVI